MSYIGQTLPADSFQGFTTDSFTGDGSATTFTLSKTPFNESALLVVINNVVQKPTTNFTVSGTTLTIVGTAVASGDVIYATHIGGALPIGQAASLDLNGASDKLILDADADTTISADTDDQIDVKIGGTDALRVTGTALTGNAVATIGATGTASTLAGIPFFSDTTNGSIYTHDVSGTDSTAEGNVAYGLQALDAITTGDYNTATGYQALSANNTGYSNVAFGQAALLANTEGYENVSIGKSSLLANTTGDRNIAIGVRANDLADTENHNISIGYESMTSAVAGGEYNVCVGSYSGYAITASDHNVLVGYAAGYDLQGGGALEGQNTCIGNNSGAQLTTGFQNICIGHSAGNGQGDSVGTDPLTGYRNILIGPYSNTQASDALHAIVIGYGISGAAQDFTFGRSSNVVSNDFDADADWGRNSDVRLKRNIQDTTLGLDFINDLRPVKFQWKPSNEIPEIMTSEYNEENQKDLDYVVHGFIAQEVKEIIDKHGDQTFGGWYIDKTDNDEDLAEEA